MNLILEVKLEELFIQIIQLLTQQHYIVSLFDNSDAEHSCHTQKKIQNRRLSFNQNQRRLAAGETRLIPVFDGAEAHVEGC